MVGIYKITNTITGHAYIGQSVCINQRWINHRKEARNGSKDYPLYRAMRKYGIENFHFEVLEECTKDLLNEREKYWIAVYHTYGDGYNQTAGGQSPTTPNPLIEEIKDELRHSDKTIKEISKIYNISQQSLAAINNGRTYFDDREDYPIRKDKFRIAASIVKQVPYNSQLANESCIDCGKKITRGCTRCAECNRLEERRKSGPRPEPVILAQEILSMGFCAVGRKYGKSDNAIRKWCKAYNMPIKKPEIQEWLNQQLDITTSNDV